jgi:hypothetical protein
MNVNRPIAAALLLVAAAAGAAAQTVMTNASEGKSITITHTMSAEAPGTMMYQSSGGAAPADMRFFTTVQSGELLFNSGQVVKGAPFSADAVTDMVQTLADGNRIVNKSTATIARDSLGRTRREQSIGGLAPMVPAGAASGAKFITIDDPANGTHYTLEANTKTARKMTMRHIVVNGSAPGETRDFLVNVAPAPAAQNAEVRVGRSIETKGFAWTSAPQQQHAEKTENLGAQTINGVVCDGTRTAITIPAGAIGNERPIETVTERWYSQELKTVVLSKTKDPRFGETIYQLTNVVRTEPSPVLFDVPSDYQVVESGGATTLRGGGSAGTVNIRTLPPQQ